MIYTKKQFGTELKAELDRGYDPVRIAKWCYVKYLDEREREDGLGEIMYEVFGMDAGPEFVIPLAELESIARSCAGENEQMDRHFS